MNSRWYLSIQTIPSASELIPTRKLVKTARVMIFDAVNAWMASLGEAKTTARNSDSHCK